MSNKPYQGRIKNWTILPQGQKAQQFIIIGDFLDHPWIRQGGTTSRILKFDLTSGEIETANSRYTLVSEGEETPCKDWPNKGDWYRFLGKNGSEHERKEAQAIFVIGRPYKVENCDVGPFDHKIKFIGIPGQFNGVMFKKVEL